MQGVFDNHTKLLAGFYFMLLLYISTVFAHIKPASASTRVEQAWLHVLYGAYGLYLYIHIYIHTNHTYTYTIQQISTTENRSHLAVCVEIASVLESARARLSERFLRQRRHRLRRGFNREKTETSVLYKCGIAAAALCRLSGAHVHSNPTHSTHTWLWLFVNAFVRECASLALS